MNKEKIYILIGKEYLKKNQIINQELFLNGIQNSSYDNYDLLSFIKEYLNMNEFTLGIFLRIVIIYFLKKEKVKSYNIDNFIQRISSIILKDYINLLLKVNKIIYPLNYNVITIKTSEKYLKQKSTKINFKNNELNNYIDILKNYCQDKEVLAISGIQLGIPKRIIYLKNTNLELIKKYQNKNINYNYDELRVIINPKVIKQIGITEYWEACASCLDSLCHIYRPYEVLVEYCDLKGNKYLRTFKGYETTIFMHEYDHLNGILPLDKANKIIILPKDKRKEFRKSHKYNVIALKGSYHCHLKKLYKKNNY